MQLNMTDDLNAVSGFYLVDHNVFTQTLEESEISHRWDLGSIAISYGARCGKPIWLLDNPNGGGYAIWVEEAP